MNISLKATDETAKEVELFDTIQNISSKIKAAEGASMLEFDEEYIAVITCHLPKEAEREWIKSEQSGWEHFYSFLEGRAMLAKTLLTNESIISALSRTPAKDKKKCATCHKFHGGKY